MLFRSVNPLGQTHAFLINPLPPGAIQAVSTPQISLPTYAPAPTPQPGKDSLVVITHGWIRLDQDPMASTTWVDSMSNSVAQYLTSHGLNNWQVQGYKWIDGAHQALPTMALSKADQEGKKLGDSIVAKGTWSHIHFIAFSAGAGLIQSATDEIKNPPTGLPATVVHETFLDAFAGATLEKLGVYGNGANWADSYFSRDLQFGAFTQGILPHAYNVDVTTLDPQAYQNALAGYVSGSDPGTPCYITESTHGWPIGFYSNSITGTVTSDYNGFGLPLSEENNNWSAAISHVQGNGVSYGTVQILGPQDLACVGSESTTPMYIGHGSSFPSSSTVKSATGTLQTL